MIHHGEKKSGNSLPSRSHSTMMNHGVVSNTVIFDDAYSSSLKILSILFILSKKLRFGTLSIG
jgi:hypothetical protein